ncbi:tRNA-Thr(GGU) m(6)t(6)A37 methyltransferase TsaA [Cellulosimicrobium cellulans J34]|nr:tRNA-Thr(GGU) m(6)t(6)A37 methyltransferase TsaA [Cellulosimicrobium cellulans J34]SMF53679.1 tRNA-Thr(GGU) m(6)t(6)A37 methyltransferase TsaA [Cellulosimicrobium cellulans J1]
MSIQMTPIGFVHSTRGEATDDAWDSETATIHLDSASFSPEALQGLDAFSHADIVYWFDQVSTETITVGARHPRGNESWPKVGIFAQRGKNRPNRIGLTTVRIVRVEGLKITVEGLDAIDRTPVLDIKPYMAEFAPRGATHQPAWATELMSEYW